jgi:hypothetical protein
MRTVRFYFFFHRYKKIHKLCVITADVENAPTPPHPTRRSLFKEQCSHSSFSRHSALKPDFDECTGFSCTGCGLSAPCILQLYLLMYILPVELCFICKIKLYNTQSPPLCACFTIYRCLIFDSGRIWYILCKAKET